MDSKKTITLLNALLDKATDASEKAEIEAAIKEFDSIDGKQSTCSSNGINKKNASLGVDVIGKFFIRLGSSMAAKEIIDLIHNHHW